MKETSSYGIQVSKKAFIQSLLILLALMITAGILTQVVLPGSFDRKMENGVEVVVPNSFHYHTGAVNYPIYRWFTAPFEVFASADAPVVITMILFILIIGGSFAIFDATQIFDGLVGKLVQRYAHARYRLIAILTLFFMLLGAVFGIFEEVIPLIPVMVLVAQRLGWNRLMGLGLSILPVGFGFSAAIYNPFTIGIAQQLVGLPAFSGVLYRLFIFAVIYTLLTMFLVTYAKKLDAQIAPEEQMKRNQENATNGTVNVSRKSIYVIVSGFSVLLVIMVVLPLVGLSNLSIPLIALGFLLTSFLCGLVHPYPLKKLWRIFFAGIKGIAPFMLLIAMAMSVKHIMLSGQIMDTLLYQASGYIHGMSPTLAGMWMYLIVFVLQFFIPSATAKAFLVMPILSPIGDLIPITRQSVVLAFNFGDGFSHLLYPTNPALLIALSLANVNFGKWLRWTFGIQLLVLALTMIFLALAIWFGYGPR